MAIDAEEILNCDDRPTERVDVPEWPCKVVYVRTMGGDDRDAFEVEALQRKGDLRNLRARFAARCVVDESGNRVFTDEQIVRLGAKSAKVLDRICNVAKRLNAFSDADERELAKNS